MPLSCVAYGCSNYDEKINKPGFYRFPNNNPELRQKWINACKRKNDDGSTGNPQGKNIYICKEHFIIGKFSGNIKNRPVAVGPSCQMFVHQRKLVETSNGGFKPCIVHQN